MRISHSPPLFSTNKVILFHLIDTLQVLLGLAATAAALPAYVHEEIPAEPYIHQEIPAEPYVHIEPPIDDLTLGILRPNQQQQAFQPQVQQYQQPQQFVQQPQQQFFQQPQQPAGFANGPWSGRCVNNLGQGVECRRQF